MVRLAELEKQCVRFGSKAPETKDEFFSYCFHEETLRQLLFLMKKLKWRTSNVDCFIAALALGCLHGESHRTEACFSNRMPRTISTKPAYSVRWWQKNECLPPKRDIFAILNTAAQYRYVSPVPALKGKVVEGDVRKASTMLRSYRKKVKLVITSPPYLDITDYHEDQWLRLWFLGGPMKPISGQGKDDRHRIVEGYWQFLSEAWQGIAPLLQDRAQIIVRIGGTRLGAEALRDGLLTSLNSTGHAFKLQEYKQSDIKNGQRQSSSRISTIFGAPCGGTTRGGHHGVDSDAFCAIVPPNFGSSAGSCVPERVVVAPGEPRSPVNFCASLMNCSFMSR